MVTAQNVQISSASTVTNAAEAASRQVPKVAASANNMVPPSIAGDDSSQQVDNTTITTTSSSRPNNKRPSIDNAFFNSIARRRISSVSKTKRNPVIHSQSMPIADPASMAAGHALCSSPSSDSMSDDSSHEDWLFNPMSMSLTRHDAPFFSSSADYKKKSIYTRNAFLLTTIKSIIDLNNTAMECYRVGEYDAALEALRLAESRRVRMEASPSKAMHMSMNPLVMDMSWNHAELSDSKSKCSRSSYIYQRMDFDEGMHSHMSMEKIDGSEVIDFVSVKESVDGFATIDVKRAIVHTILLFNLGQVHRRRGEFDAAAAKYEHALKILKDDANNMSQHQMLTPILHNIGQLQYRRGELATAMGTYEMALAHAQSMEDGSVHVASALNCLGVLHYHANSSDNDDGNLNRQVLKDSSTDKAMELFQKALALRQQCLGPDHVDVATTLNNIGRIHVQLDQFDQALRYYQDALRIRRASLGTSSLDYAATAFNAGQSLHQKGELNEAIKLYQEFLSVATVKFGKSHRDVAVVLSGIAQIHQEQKNYDKALELYEESLAAGMAALGEYHSEIAMLLNRMGNFHFERERLSDALKCYKRGLRIEMKVLPPDHPNIVVTYSNLGEIHRQRGEWDEAAKMYSEALEILKKKHAGADHPEVANAMNTIGLIKDQRGDSSVSLHFLQNALAMRRRLMAKNPDGSQERLDVAATLVYIGTILYRKSLFSAAIELFTESLQLRQQILGSDHRDTAFVMYNIALVHQQQGDYEKSIEYYTETLRIEKVVLGKHHKDVCMTLFKLGEVNKAAGNSDEALRCFQDSLDIERGLTTNASQSVARRYQSGPDPATMARTLCEIGNIHLAEGNVAEMMDAFNEASRLYRSAGLSPHNIVISGQHAYAIDFSFPEAAPAA
jgi:tetratricopeptide (TPR) repeat protein